ncbi:hypothetical protein PRUPE_7G016900 [Prunus persica]|uniref:Uncharacterized protein n=1 Tax=Prunus persica TaxID=3760 RepID=A0A251N515_PRUPE|nr:hypothetical protein PRUPE_7G016900 [Prunus persica]
MLFILVCFFYFVFLAVGPDLLNLFSPTPLQPFHLSLPLLLSSTHSPSAHFSFPPTNSLTLNPFLFPSIGLVVSCLLLLFISYNPSMSKLLLWRSGLCSLMVNLDQSMDHLSLMHGGLDLKLNGRRPKA